MSSIRKITTYFLAALFGLFVLFVLYTNIAPLFDWRIRREVYVRNHTKAEALLTWIFPCTQALCQKQAAVRDGMHIPLLEEPFNSPYLMLHGTDTLLKGFGLNVSVPVHVKRLSDDSVAVTIPVAAGTRFAVATYSESYQHLAPGLLIELGFTFIPGTIRWRNAVGQVCRRRFQPRVLRQMQEVEVEHRYKKTYTLESFIDLY
jgi:hypothetical protein